MPPAINGNGPLQDEVTRITEKIVEELGAIDLESGLTVICNLAGQLVCALAGGRPTGIKIYAESLAKNIITAAVTKMLHDDAVRCAREDDC